MTFMLSVTIMLLNILIAQLSLTYEMVQEESQHSLTAMRMQAVAAVEWQSRFRFWVSKYVFGCNFEERVIARVLVVCLLPYGWSFERVIPGKANA